MFQQVVDLKDEGVELKRVLDKLLPNDWLRQTPFKGWTVNRVVQHLHGADKMAVIALQNPEAFAQAKVQPAELQRVMNPQEEGANLLDIWWSYFENMCDLLGASDPSRRVPWFGPDMGVMMFTTARQMETWSHGQDIFDMFGELRRNSNRLKNIAVIGVKTYGWTFANRGLQPPAPAPYVKLTGPAGDLWEFNEADQDNMIEGDAAEFCHVVTQGRNIQDVALKVTGETAARWMEIAQCFAGGPEDPPAPGSRLVNF